MSNPAPGFEQHPGYEVAVAASDARVRVLVGDTVVADSTRALEVRETRHRPVWYLPMADVDQTLLTPTATTTYCPFKGHASYWRITAGSTRVDDALWGYENPFDECAGLRDHVAFYADRVTLEIDGERQAAEGPGRTR